ncbi:MAG: proline iminopeptidase-family hydrolase [Chloroflexi bacterium]|nr:proline iminopeptidase-family hydrolase [Chloroflexota bacterium]
MAEKFPAKEGFIPFHGYKTWYRIVGEDTPGKLPLLCLHGGPGATHDYLEPLEDMAATGRRVIFYDQLGCGNSDQPHDPSMWTIPLFIDELNTVRRELGLDNVHLLGQSWGGLLSLDYILRKPKGVASMTLASTAASIEEWVVEADRLRTELPGDVQATLLKHEAAGTTNHPEYEKATDVFNRRHLCRMDPWPDYVVSAFTKLAANPEVYHTMWGPNEFNVTGTLRPWNVRDRLHEIQVPTLVTSGEYDEATPSISETLHRGIAGSKLKIFDDSSHMCHAEQKDEYLRVLTEFLDGVEGIVKFNSK